MYINSAPSTSVAQPAHLSHHSTVSSTHGTLGRPLHTTLTYKCGAGCLLAVISGSLIVRINGCVFCTCLLWKAPSGKTKVHGMKWHLVRRCAHRFADFLPGAFEPEHGRVGEGCTDLQDAVEVLQTPADVAHGGPLLDHLHPVRRVLVLQDRRHHQHRHLQ